jgi:hypothetical protein
MFENDTLFHLNDYPVLAGEDKFSPSQQVKQRFILTCSRCPAGMSLPESEKAGLVWMSPA